IRKEFIQIRRDPRTLAITFIMPIMQLFLLGYAATNDVRNVPLAVFDQCRCVYSRQLLDAYRAADYFILAFDVDSQADLARRIDSGQAKAGLVIPPDYGDRMAAERSAQVAFILDGSDPTVASTALSAATLLGQSQSTRLQVERLARSGMGLTLSQAVDVRTQVWYNPDMVSSYFMIPALIGMILQVMTTVLTSTAIVRERERGTIEQLIVTPVRPWELIVGKMIPYVLIAFIDALEVLVIGMVWFKIPMRGSIPLLLALCALYVMTTLSIGLLVSTVTHTQQEALMLSFFTLLPMLFLSGFFFPIAAMPQFLQWVSVLIPLKYFLVIVRSIVLKGVGFSLLLQEVVALVIFGVLLMALAASRFRKRLD
ncbi:MAG: ABC transporter permease, partial [Thermoflexales bacterium]|nr:ABC transporter permease [Thermoflexales bacterium]